MNERIPPEQDQLTRERILGFIEAENWPNTYTKNAVTKLSNEIQGNLSNIQIPLGKREDITTKELGEKIAKLYEPQVVLQGQGLRAERYGNTWGGMYYRVLTDRKFDENPTKICIQYLYTWVLQNMPFTFWNWIFPLFVLMILGIFANWMPYQIITGVGDPDLAAYHERFTTYWYPFAPLVASGGMVFLQGVYILLSLRNERYIPQNSIIYFIMGLLFIPPLLLELINSSCRRIFTFKFSLSSMGFVIGFGAVSIGIVVLILISAILIKYQHADRMVKIRKSKLFSWLPTGIHTMDYAPVFVYLKHKSGSNKLDEASWEFDRCEFDQVHYCRGLTRINKQKFFIDNNWHSFNPKPNPLFEFLSHHWNGFIKFLIILGVPIVAWWVVMIQFETDYFYLFFGNYDIIDLLGPIASIAWTASLIFIILVRPTNLGSVFRDDDNVSLDFKKRMFHLTPNILLVLWNLPGDAELLIRERLQDPWIIQPDNKTFYDKTHDKAESIICEPKKHFLIRNLDLIGILLLIFLFNILYPLLIVFL
ncbi:MAG: hypothetical protein ACFFAU_13845 [Candidatus Hodarchaeota archaeon]